MSESDDPLLSFLLGELEQIEEAVGLTRHLTVPTVPLDASHGEPQTFSWSIRFTWQEVERSRRYVLPLDRERARAAQRPVIDEIVSLVKSQIDGDPDGHALPAGGIRRRVKLNANLNVYSVLESIDIGPLQRLQAPTTRAVGE